MNVTVDNVWHKGGFSTDGEPDPQEPPTAPHSSTRTEEQEQTTPQFLHLSYVCSVSKSVGRKCRRLGIRTTFKLKGTLRKALVQAKDYQSEWKKKGVMYQVPCAECESVYMGETGRTLEKRISEHKGAVKRHDVKNGIVVHAWTKQHKVDWQAATFKHLETNHLRRKTIEALHIHLQRETSNLDCGRTLSPVWHPLLWTPLPLAPTHLNASTNCILTSCMNTSILFMSHIIYCHIDH